MLATKHVSIESRIPFDHKNMNLESIPEEIWKITNMWKLNTVIFNNK